MIRLTGEPSDQAPAILATGNSGITRVFLSMSERHPDGGDAAYLAWHSLDHRPEQYRLPELRASLRLVSTPACRAARAASLGPFDAVDHVMTYMFASDAGFAGFGALSVALREAGRVPYLLPSIERSVYELGEIVAAPRIIAGADVLPWWPARGIYVVISDKPFPVRDLVDVPGVGGVWSAIAAGTVTEKSGMAAGASRNTLAYCFLEDEPAEVGEGLKPILQQRWRDSGATALLAAPFHIVVPHEWDRYLP